MTPESPDWRMIVAQIRSKGRMRHADIAAEVDCALNTIDALSCGRSNNPHYQLGAALINLHQRIMDREAKRSTRN